MQINGISGYHTYPKQIAQGNHAGHSGGHVQVNRQNRDKVSFSQQVAQQLPEAQSVTNDHQQLKTTERSAHIEQLKSEVGNETYYISNQQLVDAIVSKIRPGNSEE